MSRLLYPTSLTDPSSVLFYRGLGGRVKLEMNTEKA